LEALAIGGGAFSPVDLAQQPIREAVAPADDLQPRTALAEPSRFKSKKSAQQPEDPVHLVGRAGPVVRRKRIERQPPDADVRRTLDYTPSRGNSCSMSSDPG
jgi:hypothetical protein